MTVSVVTAAECGLVSCHHCRTVWQDAADNAHCGVCGGTLHSRKPDSLNRTWAFLIAACIMYIPANLLPVMVTSTLLDQQRDTIMSGIIYFWLSGSWELALVVFVASFLVPLFKLVALILLTVTARRRSSWQRLQRAKLFRLVEAIGRWSMLDVFVVALLAGLVQIEGFARITAGFGVAAFGSVVVLTMLASLSFDPRLIWDEGQEEEQEGELDEATEIVHDPEGSQASHVTSAINTRSAIGATSATSATNALKERQQ
ncbi:paraquat-inducible protein A [Herbaspirillum sp. Sphag1AN]|uniref:paraquat-inducible protein A n=1 Tax=unclassified Herbaspirillum TaxID=2624150 RepID=UPI00162048E9|nr:MULTISPECIES: paraquat-inducible protein A [unclassified Herbaspirillum]MBB3211557.1 paraquat-inducible protein A [Herbaspirillum sp. Sphag1AN]MBB3245176.1 paraquat-inducible protein A [Herbaspirillum sp. Sphag64]